MNPLKSLVAVLLTGLLIAGGSSGSAIAANPCSVTDATLTWGFKESFRSYISSAIANGEWTVSDGATYETPDFGWTDGTGSYEPANGEGLVRFTGSIRFTGHGGVLDTTVANPQLRFLGDGDAMLLLDVAGVTQDGAPIDQKAVEFAELDLADAVDLGDGDVTITAAPAALTPDGATAFGTYEADEPLDPLSATFTLSSACVATAVDGTPASSNGPNWIMWVVSALVGLALVVAIVVVLVRVRRPHA